MARSLEFLERLGWDESQRHETRLANALAKALEPLSHATVLMGPASSRLALASAVPHSTLVSPDTIACIFSDSHGMMVRSGYHCAQPFFDHLQLQAGAVRAPAYIYNTVEEVTQFGKTLVELMNQFLGSP